MLHNGLETSALEAFLRGFRGFLIGIGTDLDVIILVGLRSDDEGRKLFLLQRQGNSVSVNFLRIAATCTV